MTKTNEIGKAGGSKKLNRLQFGFLLLNYIVGFGFLSTVGEIIDLGAYGILVFVGTTLISLGVLVTFSKLAQRYPNVEGSSYGFAKKVFGRNMTFFQGWNQFIQGPVIAATAPIFLQTILNQVDSSLSWLWKTISISLFLIFTIISTAKIKSSFKWIAWFASVKWILIGFAVILSIILSIQNNFFSSAFASNDGITIGAITGAMLSFIFAFGGIEGMTTLTRDTDSKSIRKTYFYVFAIILAIYFSLYIIILGAVKVDELTSQIVRTVFNSLLGITGVVLFFIGNSFNKAASITSSSLVSARTLGPLGQDGYFPKVLGKKSKDDIFVVSTYVSALLSIVSLIIFEVIPEYVDLGDNFIAVIKIGTLAFLVQYLMTGITAIKMHYKQKLKFNLLELAIIGLMIILILFVIITQALPIDGSFGAKNIIIDIAYPSWMLIGYIAWGLTHYLKKRKKKKQDKKNIHTININK